jgi:hypothetical protein
MEVPMLNTKRHLPQFDSLEGKVLLSAGMANSAATKHHDKAKPFVMTGTLSGLPNGSPGVAGYTATSFPVAGHLASMGTVQGSFSLANPYIPIGKLPDLAGASLTLENSKGTVQLAIAQTKKNNYKFTVDAGTGKYTSTSGAGTMKISSTHAAIDLVISLHSTAVKKT